MIATAGNRVGLGSDAQLFGLVVELLSKHEQVLAELLCLLSQLSAHDVAIALGHLPLSLALAPVEQRNTDAHLHHLVGQQVAIGPAQVVGIARIAHLRIEIHALPVGACRSYGIVGLQLSAAHGRSVGVVLESVGKHVVVGGSFL